VPPCRPAVSALGHAEPGLGMSPARGGVDVRLNDRWVPRTPTWSSDKVAARRERL
jgi:hypothetical protein